MRTHHDDQAITPFTNSLSGYLRSGFAGPFEQMFPQYAGFLPQSTDGYDGPYNPFLEHLHRTTSSMLKLTALGVAMQRDATYIYRDLATWFGQPLMLQELQEYVEKVASANVTMFEQLTREYGKPKFELDTTVIDDRVVAVREQVVRQWAFCDLVHFERDVERNDPKVLLIAPQSGHYATLLRPTVERLLPEAEVYVTDWISAREVDPSEGEFDLSTYADYLREMIVELGPEVNVISICQSTVPAVMAIARIAEDDPSAQPATLTLMAGPLDPAAAPTAVTELADRMHLRSYLQTFIAQAPNGRKVYPGYVQLMAFISMNPQNHFSSHRDLYRYHVADDTNPEIERIERFYREYFAVADLTAEFYADTVDRVFIKKELASGSMYYRGKIVRPDLVTCPIIGVEGAKDDISAPGQTRNFLSRFTASSDVSFYEQEHAGHYGVFAGGHWRNQIAPRILGKIHETAQKDGRSYDEPQRPTMTCEPYTD